MLPPRPVRLPEGDCFGPAGLAMTGACVRFIQPRVRRRNLRHSMARRQRNGVPLLPLRNPHPVVTPDIVNVLRDATL